MAILTPLTQSYNSDMEATITKGLTYCLALPNRAVYVLSEEDIRRNQERESTKRLKELFLNILERNRGLITNVCEKTGISRGTYYNWLRTDKEFKEKVDEIMRAKPEMLEDILYVAAAKGDVGAAKFILSHIHPDYKKQKSEKDTTVNIHHYVHKDSGAKSGSITFSEMIWAEGAKRRKEALAKMVAEEMRNKILDLEEES